MATFTGSVRLPGGQVVPASGACTVRPRLLVGVDVQGAKTTLAEIDQHIGPSGLFPAFRGPTKMFWDSGAGLPTWTGKTARIPSRSIPHLCFVDVPTKAQWVGLLDSMPATWPIVWLTGWQEGDRKYAPADFKAKWAPIIDWTHAHPNRKRVRLVVNLTEFWQRVHNGNDYAAFIPPGLDPAQDRLGADVYPGGQTGYLSPAKCLAGPIAAGKAAGLKVVIPEFGVVVPTNPTAAHYQARADWYAGIFTVAEQAGIEAVSPWCTTGAQDAGTGGFHLAPGRPDYAVVRGRQVA